MRKFKESDAPVQMPLLLVEQDGDKELTDRSDKESSSITMSIGRGCWR